MPVKDRTTKSFREHNRKYQNEWYHKNKESAMASRRRYKDKLREAIIEYKQTLSCECGESDIRCLDFHHKDESTKEFNISAAVKRGYSIERIFKEIEKCEVLCANCHRKHHDLGYTAGWMLVSRKDS